MTTEIRICMGSACFARGNSENLEFIENYIKENNLDAKVEIYGSRCSDNCEKGPNININGKDYTFISKQMLIEILENIFS